MNKTKSVRWLSLLLAVVMVVCILPMGTFVKAGVTSYDDFMGKLKTLEVYAEEYAAATYRDPGELVLNFIRTGVSRYLDDNWQTLAGQEIIGFTNYVEAQDAEKGTSVMSLRDKKTENGTETGIKAFNLDNGDSVDFGHMFGCMNISYINKGSADLSGWAGDLCDLLYYCSKQSDIPAGTVDEMADYIRENCFGVDASEAFGLNDFYGDMDAYYLISEYNKAGGTKKFSEIMENYFTDTLDNVARTAYFMNNRFGVADEDEVKEKELVRKAIYDSYSSDVGIKILESKRGLSSKNDLRTACCYALADYIYSFAKGNLVEGSGDNTVVENGYYSVFSNEESILAPGISQEIKYAQTVDGKQIVYYVATVDVNRDDVMIMANYKDNDPSKGWGLQTVLEQTNALVKNYKDKTDENGNKLYENFNPIVATNGDAYNIYNGVPGGLLIMDGKEWYGVDHDGFFAILKNGSAMIGTQADYATYKDQIKEAIGGFGAVLVKDGKINVTKNPNYTASRASRTAVGITAEGKVVMMVMDGRQQPFSAGGSMEEIAQVMLEAGCVHAINLDGGGSTTYLSKPAGSDEIQLVNRPSDGYQRNVAATLVAISTAKPSNEFDTAIITSDYEYITAGTSMQMNVTGISNTGNAAEIPADSYWRVSDESIGSIDKNGVFTAEYSEEEPITGDVTVEYVVNGEVKGTKILHVVIPDDITFAESQITAVYGKPKEIAVKVWYKGMPVAFTPMMDALLLFEPGFDEEGNPILESNAGVIEGTTFTGNDTNGVRTVKIIAAVQTGEDVVLTRATINLYYADEATFDFDNATMGNRSLAWIRDVKNAKSNDNQLYRILDPNSPVEIDYTFALDMSAIEMPTQLEPLKSMLPDGTDPNSTAWTFLLALAERICVQTNVTIRAEFSKELNVDIRGLKISTEYFTIKSADLSPDNVLTLVCQWKDQTQAIDAATANPLCILSGIKATVKDNAAYFNNEVTIANNGTVSYDIYLATSALHSFASDPVNQATYGLYPFEHSDEEYPDGCRGDDHDTGGHFSSQYVDFADYFVVNSEVLQGWHEDYYYVDNVPVTGLQLVPDRHDSTQKRFYEFDENGKIKSEQGVTGLIEFDGGLYYPALGVVRTGWYEIDGYYYYFDPDTGKAANGEIKVREYIYPTDTAVGTRDYTYYFENHKLVKGEMCYDRAGSTYGYRYRWAGDWITGTWFKVDGKTYHAGQHYPYFITTGCPGYVANYPSDKDYQCYLFDETGALMEDYKGPGFIESSGVYGYFVNGILNGNPGLKKSTDGYYYFVKENWSGHIYTTEDVEVPANSYGIPAGTYHFDEYGRLTKALVSVDSKPAGVTTEVIGSVVTVNSAEPCRAYYLDGNNYVALDAMKNTRGTGYNFAADNGTTVKIVLAGDVDGNGAVNDADLAALADLVTGGKAPEGVASVTADINDNGVINSADRILLARRLLDKTDAMYKGLEW